MTTVGEKYAKNISVARNTIARSRLSHHEREKWLNEMFGAKVRDDMPTPERLAKGSFVGPETNQTVKRKYHRSLDLFDRLYNKGDLDQAQYAAALKLRKHYEGGLDRDVRESDDSSGELNDLDGIPARTYHSAKIAEARRNVPDEAWRILEMGLLGCEHLEDLGRFVFRIVNEKTARRRARAAIADGLDILALLWGLAHGPPSR